MSDLDDAIRLLKEHGFEPVVLADKIRPRGMYGGDKCGRCLEDIGPMSRYCWACGAKFKEEQN